MKDSAREICKSNKRPIDESFRGRELVADMSPDQKSISHPWKLVGTYARRAWMRVCASVATLYKVDERASAWRTFTLLGASALHRVSQT